MNCHFSKKCANGAWKNYEEKAMSKPTSKIWVDRIQKIITEDKTKLLRLGKFLLKELAAFVWLFGTDFLLPSCFFLGLAGSLTIHWCYSLKDPPILPSYATYNNLVYFGTGGNIAADSLAVAHNMTGFFIFYSMRELRLALVKMFYDDFALLSPPLNFSITWGKWTHMEEPDASLENTRRGGTLECWPCSPCVIWVMAYGIPFSDSILKGQ